MLDCVAERMQNMYDGAFVDVKKCIAEFCIINNVLIFLQTDGVVDHVRRRPRMSSNCLSSVHRAIDVADFNDLTFMVRFLVGAACWWGRCSKQLSNKARERKEKSKICRNGLIAKGNQR
jgi:hypothetical protein